MDHSELTPGNESEFSELFLVQKQMILERIVVNQDPAGQKIMIKRTELNEKD